jgi:membrane protein
MGEVPVDRVKSIASRLPERLRQHNLTLVAAGVAYYAFLAFVPAIVAFISIYGLVADAADVERQVGDVAGALPAEVQDFLVFQLTSIIDAGSAGVSIALIIAIVLALWSASGGMAALITGLHIAHGQDEPKGFVAKRGKALSLTFGAMVFLGVVVFLVAALPPLLSNAGLGAAGRVALNILRWPILAAVMIVGIGSLYRFAVPGRPVGWLGFLTPGTVVAMLGWLVVSALFAVYTANFASLSKTYGALATIVVVLLWLWLSSLLVLIGAEVDAVDEGERGPHATRAARLG